MNHVEAFSALGYELARPYYAWSAVSDDGVCITLWNGEIDWFASPIFFDSSKLSHTDWMTDGKWNCKKEHMRLALERYGGFVDVVLKDGMPATHRKGKDDPWHPKKRKGAKWRITDLNETTNHYRVELTMP